MQDIANIPPTPTLREKLAAAMAEARVSAEPLENCSAA